MSDDTKSRRSFATGLAVLGAAGLLVKSNQAKATTFTDQVVIGEGGTPPAPSGCIYSDQTWGMLFRGKHASPTYLFGWAPGTSDNSWPGAAWMLMYPNGALSTRAGVENVGTFGADGYDPSTPWSSMTIDHTATIQAAIDSLGAAGGTVYLNASKKYLIAGTLNVKPGVTLAGHMTKPDFRRVGNNTTPPDADLLLWGSQLVLGGSGSINLQSSAALRNLIVIYWNIQSATAGPSLPSATANFSSTNTAVTLSGEGCVVRDVFIGGFNQAIDSQRSRPTIDGVIGDNTNGVVISNADDTARVMNCQFWPFLTSPNGADQKRSGAAFKVSSTGQSDWVRFHNCFCYGYLHGFHIDGGDAILLSLCGVDNTGDHANSVGYWLTNSSAQEIRIDMCQAAANDFGAYSFCGSSTYLQRIFISNSQFFENTYGFQSAGATQACFIRLTGCSFTDGANGISVAGGSTNPSYVYYGTCVFHGNTVANVSVTPGAHAIISFGDNTDEAAPTALF